MAWEALQFGDRRCNRTAFGVRVDDRWVPLFDPDVPRDLATRDRGLDHFGGMNFGGTRPALLVAKVARVLVRHPRDLPVASAGPFDWRPDPAGGVCWGPCAVARSGR